MSGEFEALALDTTGLGSDKGNPSVCRGDCTSANPPSFCPRRWCYVDPETCGVDKQKCLAEGGQPGSDEPKHLAACRSRVSNPSECLGPLVGKDQAHYSYQTCGDFNVYDTPDQALHNYTFKALVLEDAWWVTSKKPDTLGLRKLGDYWGVMVEMWLDTISNGFSGVQTIPFGPDGVSADARNKSGSLWTAAAIDVGLGNQDTVISSTWITGERLKYVTFLPPLGYDYLYLYVMDDGNSEDSFGEVCHPLPRSRLFDLTQQICRCLQSRSNHSKTRPGSSSLECSLWLRWPFCLWTLCKGILRFIPLHMPRKTSGSASTGSLAVFHIQQEDQLKLVASLSRLDSASSS